MKDTLEIDIELSGPEEADTGIIVAILGESGYDAFRLEDNRVYVYADPERHTESEVRELLGPFSHLISSICSRKIPYRNWNEIWEKSYDPVDILDNCRVRAAFHPPAVDRIFDLVISPKMSFGTAHHETTRLMLEYMLSMDWKGKTILDLGCGTGILGILAVRMGASRVTGVDNDPQACLNARENSLLNGTEGMEILEGDCRSVRTGPFGVLLANINLNVLLNDIACMAGLIESGGLCIMSGFFDTDLARLDASAAGHHLVREYVNTLNRWTVAVYIKAV